MFGRAVIAVLALPGVFGAAVPLAVAATDPWRVRGHGFGVVVIGIGGLMLGRCILDFYRSGKGTLAPWAPPERFVVTGLYRYTRNPMYIAVLFIVCGIALFFGSPLAAVYCIVLSTGFHLRVVLHEEPWLARRFGEAWQKYEAAVPRWVPRSLGRRVKE